MFLELWMLAILVLAFGLCGYTSTRIGYNMGARVILSILCNRKIVYITKDGEIVPYRKEFDVKNSVDS